MQVSKKIVSAGLFGLLLAAGFTHLWLPASVDECQSDITHHDHLLSLAPFHCIGHTERNYPADEWNHVHPWMDKGWEEEQPLR
jgi:hypothetical protein